MQRGYDALRNPVGVALVIASLMLIVAICAWGSGYLKRKVAEDEAARRRYRDSIKRDPDS